MRAALALVLALSSICFAAAGQTVEAQGSGRTRDEAVKAALRAAVEQTVGALISSQSVVENNALIRDRILAYSPGYVEDYSVLSEEMRIGAVEVRVAARVSSLRLRTTLDSLHIGVGKLPGQAISIQLETRAKAEKDAASFLAPALEKWPKAAYAIEVGEPVVKASSEEIVRVAIGYTLAFDRAWVQELQDATAAIATETLRAPNPAKLIREARDQGRFSIAYAIPTPSAGPLSFGSLTVAHRIGRRAFESLAAQFGRSLELKMVFYDASREIVFTQALPIAPRTRMMMGDEGFVQHMRCQLEACAGDLLALVYTGAKSSDTVEVDIPRDLVSSIASVEMFFD